MGLKSDGPAEGAVGNCFFVAARLKLAASVKEVVAVCLGILGITAPERM
jgi:arginyl-tRNA synthetase